MKKRLIEVKILEYLKIYGAILVTGPRGCGKTTSCSKIAKSKIILINQTTQVEEIRKNYDSIFKGAKPKLIDE
jgi:predicted AAA+ superfamily ATPase